MESVHRIMNIPLVESGWGYAGHFYGRLKQSNDAVQWALGRAETSLDSVLSTARPVVVLFRGPLSVLDKVLCQGLDAVEEKVPSIALPPEMIFWNTKRYVDDRIMRPILRRADSVKQMGHTVLESRYTAYAADTLDGALSIADRYVDMYLPATDVEKMEEGSGRGDGRPRTGDRAVEAILHMDRFSRKLQRRLTERTFAEAKALRQHSTEAMHVLTYVLELIATDPELAYRKSRELWLLLSEAEPENQARPENLEELVVMVARESTRRVIHLVNFANACLVRLPDETRTLAGKCATAIEEMFKVAQMEDINQTILELVRVQAHRFTLSLRKLNLYTTELLEQLAKNLEQQEQNIKSVPCVSKPAPVASPRDALASSGAAAHGRASRKYTNIVNGTDNVPNT